MEKIKASGFDKRDVTKLEFLNIYHTFKNFKLNAMKTQNDSLSDYLKFMINILQYI